MLWAAQYGTIDSTAGTGYELQTIAAVVVGGVAIFGGSGSVVGAALGALLLNTINSALYVLGISSFWDQAIAGCSCSRAIALDRAINAAADRGAAAEVAPWRLSCTRSPPDASAWLQPLAALGDGAHRRESVAVVAARRSRSSSLSS